MNVKEQSTLTVGMGSKTNCDLCGADAVNTLSAPDRFHGRDVWYRLNRCPICSLVWLAAPPTGSDLGRHYGADYHRAITNAAETTPERWQRHRHIISRHKTKGTVLDVGCSSGSFLNAMKGSDWKLYGIELSSQEAERARLRTGAQVFNGDIVDAPFASGTFDVITCLDVFEHLNRPKEALQKIQQWLKPGGIFYAFVPNIDSWEARFFRSYWFGLELPRHLYHFSPASLRKLAASTGLRELSLATPAVSYAEHSIHYVYNDVLNGVGFKRDPLSSPRPAPFVWKVVRKVLRESALNAFRYVASAAGKAAAIEVVLAKPPVPVDFARS
jgi:2-polyprenyl-3-methyl-5-hydroxy-6-metoxy-1,4-benzoquinol methylase